MLNANVRPFTETLSAHNLSLERKPIEILQVNLGKRCNQACLHCHVQAGPDRDEVMEKTTMDRILELLSTPSSIHTVDITGGAPELNPHFRYLVEKCRGLGKQVINRCNLSVLLETDQENTPVFFRDNQVHVIASMPCYSKDNVDGQRGNGVFNRCIKALKRLNRLGYGKKDSHLILDLVYNPSGAFLPPSQTVLENDYKRELFQQFGIEFNHLYTITNMPINRFLRNLEIRGNLQAYMDILVENFNPMAVMDVMCLNLVSISWDGRLFDCDFNQSMDLGVNMDRMSIWDIVDFAGLSDVPIVMADHCYGCSAGAGSSCKGALI